MLDAEQVLWFVSQLYHGSRLTIDLDHPQSHVNMSDVTSEYVECIEASI
jgi:hypothetical protein